MTRAVLLACLFAAAPFAGLAAQSPYPRPVFDAPMVVLSNNDSSIIELLDSNGDGRLETLHIRIDIGQTTSFMSVSARSSTGGVLGHGAYVPTAGPMEPFSAVGQVWTPDAPQDCAVGAGRTVWVFRGAPLVGAPTATLTVNGELRGVAIADFDGDGLGDVATLTDLELTVHRAGAVPSFTPITFALSPGAGSHLVAGEFDGDGMPDLAVIGSSAALHHVSGGALAPLQTIPVNMPNPMPAAGDIDNDGDVDLIVFGDTSYVVLRRTGPSSFTPEPAVVGGPATHLIDVDGDGDLDGACCSGGGSPPAILYAPSIFRVSINDNGVFLPAYELHGIGAWHLAGIADMNGDGLPDLVAGRAIYFARQSLAIPPQAASPAGTISAHTLCDLDADGDPDWLAGPGALHWNRGDGTLDVSGLPLLQQPPPGTTYGAPVIPGDWDGDGDIDLIVETRENGSPAGTRLLLQRGGVFADGGQALPSGITLSPWIGTDPSRVVVGDIDGDGDLDLVGNSPGPGLWSHRWLNDGSGHFILGQVSTTEVVVAIADITGDGIPDLIVSDTRLMLRRGLGGGTFNFAEIFTGSGTHDPFRDTIAVADFDGDGQLEVIAAERSPNLSGAFPALFDYVPGALPSLVRMGGPHGFNLTGVQPSEPVRLIAADVDGDGRPDVVVGNPFNAGWNGVGVAFGTGTWPPFDSTRTQQLLAPVHALADLDGDGDLDGVGPRIVLGRVFDGPTAGARNQWGVGTAGTDGIVPKLGASGPVRAGRPLTFRMSGAVGGACGILALGLQTRALPIFGGTSYVEPLAWTLVCAQGAPGLGGDGRASHTLPLIPPSVIGLTVHAHAGFVDPAHPHGFAMTNALTVRIGQ